MALFIDFQKSQNGNKSHNLVTLASQTNYVDFEKSTLLYFNWFLQHLLQSTSLTAPNSFLNV